MSACSSSRFGRLRWRCSCSLGEGKTISKYRKDQNVFSQGEVADAVFYIQQGKVKLTVVSEQGKEAVVAILGPGHFFGEGCLNGHPLRIATTRAVDECVIARLEKATMIATIHNEPDFWPAPKIEAPALSPFRFLVSPIYESTRREKMSAAGIPPNSPTDEAPPKCKTRTLLKAPVLYPQHHHLR